MIPVAAQEHAVLVVDAALDVEVDVLVELGEDVARVGFFDDAGMQQRTGVGTRLDAGVPPASQAAMITKLMIAATAAMPPNTQSPVRLFIAAIPRIYAKWPFYGPKMA